MATIITMPKFDFQEYKYSQLEKEEEMYFWDRKVCSFFPQLNFCILTKVSFYYILYYLVMKKCDKLKINFNCYVLSEL